MSECFYPIDVAGVCIDQIIGILIVMGISFLIGFILLLWIRHEDNNKNEPYGSKEVDKNEQKDI